MATLPEGRGLSVQVCGPGDRDPADADLGAGGGHLLRGVPRAARPRQGDPRPPQPHRHQDTGQARRQH